MLSCMSHRSLSLSLAPNTNCEPVTWAYRPRLQAQMRHWRQQDAARRNHLLSSYQGLKERWSARVERHAVSQRAVMAEAKRRHLFDGVRVESVPVLSLCAPHRRPLHYFQIFPTEMRSGRVGGTKMVSPHNLQVLAINRYPGATFEQVIMVSGPALQAVQVPTLHLTRAAASWRRDTRRPFQTCCWGMHVFLLVGTGIAMALWRTGAHACILLVFSTVVLMARTLLRGGIVPNSVSGNSMKEYQELDNVNIWTEDEKAIFLERFVFARWLIVPPARLGLGHAHPPTITTSFPRQSMSPFSSLRPTTFFLTPRPPPPLRVLGT